jgi:DNA-binding PadR family transcriptional regulator
MAYQQYKSEMGEKELLKWLKKWRKFTDKIVDGYLVGEYPELSISVE